MGQGLLYGFLKRSLDIFASLVALIILSPLTILIFILIRLSGKGPAIFKQQRAGLNAKPFTLYKFRTMTTDTDPFGNSPKSGDDPRLTSTGKFLRERSLDELPQLYNVLKGQMTLVGPRPLYVSQIPEWTEQQKQRLLVKPGLTGLAQISGRGALTREQKLNLDVQYVQKRGLWLDIKILLSTVGTVFGRKSIYEKKYSDNEQSRGQSD